MGQCPYGLWPEQRVRWLCTDLRGGGCWLIHLAAGVYVVSQIGVFGSEQPGYDVLMNRHYDKKRFIEETVVIIIHFISETQQHLAYFEYLQWNNELHPFPPSRLSTQIR